MGPVNKQPGTHHTVLLLIEIFDTLARVLVLTKMCLVFFGVEFGLIIPQLQFLDIHCKGRCGQTGFAIKGCRPAKEAYQPSSTASETSSKARPSRFWERIWVLVRAGIAVKSQVGVAVVIWNGSEGGGCVEISG
jgi:hypothetical protein